MRLGQFLSYAAGMRVALCQVPISPDPAVNLGRAKAALGDAAATGAELAVFPEGTQAHFGSDLRAVAEPTDGAFCTGLAEAARDHGIAVVAGVFEPGPATGSTTPPSRSTRTEIWSRHTGRSTCSMRSASASPTRSRPGTRS